MAFTMLDAGTMQQSRQADPAHSRRLWSPAICQRTKTIAVVGEPILALVLRRSQQAANQAVHSLFAQVAARRLRTRSVGGARRGNGEGVRRCGVAGSAGCVGDVEQVGDGVI